MSDLDDEETAMSDHRPLIGITGRRRTAGQLADTAEALGHLDGDWFYADYVRAVLEAGGLPVHLPLDVDPALFVGRLDGVLLSGGTDVSPEAYAAVSETDKYPPEPERDEFELALLDAALSAATPVLGICRGIQIMNVHAGGTLHQDVPEHARYDLPLTCTTHPIEIVDNSALYDIYGSRHVVNSLHHQTIARLGPDLVSTATHEDTIEAVEHISLPMIAVQWHPELLDTRDTDPLFAWLVGEAANHADSR